jgi:SAM-dependent methyltransferase
MSLYSPTEKYGLGLLTEADKSVLSVGISTAGAAEIQMAQRLSERRIIATTIDRSGVGLAKDAVKNAGVSDQVEVRLEDIASDLPYADETFDFIYARLVLHYLPKQQLEKAVQNIARVLRDSGKLFVVVRSTDCLEAKDPKSLYDSTTCMTTYHTIDHPDVTASRYFHSDASIKDVLTRHGFVIDELTHVKEALAFGFERDILSTHKDDLIQLVAHKNG